MTIIVPHEHINDKDCFEYQKQGFSIVSSAAQGLDLVIDNPVLELEPKLCVFSVQRIPKHFSNTTFEPIFSWIKEHNFKSAGDIWCSILGTMGHEGYHYCDILVAIE
jgi:hypothetical protein